MRKARLILNPISWARRPWSMLPDLIGILESAGVRVDLTFTKIDHTMTESVELAAEEGYDLVIAGGGDGTVSEVANGLVGKGIPLGILPIGTYNNIAHSLHVPLDLSEAARIICIGKVTDIDVGIAGDTYFFEAVGVGLDASLFPIGEEIKGGHYEKVLKGAMSFLRQQHTEIDLRFDGQQVNLQSPMVVIANGPYYGAGFTIAPQASMADGLLEIITFECSRVEVARHFALSAQNREHVEPCVAMLRAREITITSPQPLPAHADGKPIGSVPITCRVIPGALRVIVP